MTTPIMQYCIRSLVWLLCIAHANDMFGNFMSQNSRHDPFPVYTSRDPHSFLYMYDILTMKGKEPHKSSCEKLGLALSVWGQNSDSAKDYNKNTISPGNLDGRWSMVGLVFGETPEGKMLPPSLQQAQAALFPGQTPPITDQTHIDQNELCGFIDVQTKYKNRGFRFDWSVQLIGDLGLTIEGGMSDICYTVTHFNDLTCLANVLCGCESSSDTNNGTEEECLTCDKCTIKTNLTCKLKTIANEIGLDIDDFHKNALEDFRAHLYWRHAYDINYGRDNWSELVILPFLVLSASAATGTQKDPNEAFGLSSGNNDHNAVGFTSGIMFDFVDTISIGAEGGFTHFFDRE